MTGTGKRLRIILKHLRILRWPGIVIFVAGGLLDGAFHLGHAVRTPGGYIIREPLTHIIIVTGIVLAWLGWLQPPEKSS